VTESLEDGRVVVVGAGLAGGSATVALREGGFRGPIVLIGQEPGVPFGRPPLSKTYLRGEEPLTGWYVKPGEWFEHNGVELRTGANVVAIDTNVRQVLLAGGKAVSFDKLLLCTGARSRRLQVPGANLPGVHYLRTIADCDAIRSEALAGRRAVVVGMGFIGSEVAASLCQIGLRVTTVLSGRTPLAAVLGDEVGAALGDIHRSHGVNLLTDSQVVAFEGSHKLERVVTAGGARLDCDLAVVGVGVEPRLDALKGTPLNLANGILVDERCRTNVPNVYAAGDVANHLHPLFGRLRVEHYNNAEKQGRAAARSMLGDARPYAAIHTFWSDQFEHKLEYVGFARKWDEFVIRGNLESRRFLGFYLSRGIIRAAVGLNRGGDPELDEKSELYACMQLVQGRAQPAPAALSDERVDLQSLLASADSQPGGSVGDRA